MAGADAGASPAWPAGFRARRKSAAQGAAAVRLVAVGLVVAMVLAGCIAARVLPASTILHFENALEHMRDLGALGMLLFGALQVAVALSGFVPGSLIGIFAGAVYGVAIGFPLAALGIMTGALLAFGFARTLLRPLLSRWLAGRARLRDFDAALARDGWRVVCLLRLSPIMPFAATSYALGTSAVTLKDYLIGTLASLPALFGYVVIGAFAKAGFAAAAQGTGLVQWALIGGGLAATVVLTWRIGRIAMAAGLVSRARLANGA
jgi:uncharacterized membrane protein YdjX (TVP38/TMEM64 family)